MNLISIVFSKDPKDFPEGSKEYSYRSEKYIPVGYIMYGPKYKKYMKVTKAVPGMDYKYYSAKMNKYSGEKEDDTFFKLGELDVTPELHEEVHIVEVK